MNAAHQPETLAARAERLYPGNPTLQAAWLRAITLVRTTRGGWLLDRHQPRREGGLT